MPKILRITLFKFNDVAVIQDAIPKYSTLTQDAKKDGKPYVISASASPTHNDPRNQGFNFCARTTFESKEDMDYYDNDCEAHKAIKAFLKPRVAGPPLMVYMDA